MEKENAWQTLVYSPLGVVLSPPSEYLWDTPNYWSPQCLSAPPLSERKWTNRGKKFLRLPYNFLRITLGSLNQVSLDFYVMYRNDCRLKGWNRNCSIPIQFGTRVCWMKDERQIAASLRQNFHSLPHFYSEVTGPMFTIFLHDVNTYEIPLIIDHHSAYVYHISVPLLITKWMSSFVTPINLLQTINI